MPKHEDLTPIDPARCQAEIRTGSFMTLGPRTPRRCQNKPAWIAFSVAAGNFGAMALCDECQQVCEKQMPETEFQRLLAAEGQRDAFVAVLGRIQAVGRNEDGEPVNSPEVMEAVDAALGGLPPPWYTQIEGQRDAALARLAVLEAAVRHLTAKQQCHFAHRSRFGAGFCQRKVGHDGAHHDAEGKSGGKWYHTGSAWGHPDGLADCPACVLIPALAAEPEQPEATGPGEGA